MKYLTGWENEILASEQPNKMWCLPSSTVESPAIAPVVEVSINTPATVPVVAAGEASGGAPAVPRVGRVATSPVQAQTKLSLHYEKKYDVVPLNVNNAGT